MTILLTTDINTAAATVQANNQRLQQQLDIATSACLYARDELVSGYAVEDRPVADPHRAAGREPKAPTDAAFEEPAPSAGATQRTGFAERPPALKP